MDDKKRMSVSEYAELRKIAISTVYKYIRLKKVLFERVGYHYLIITE